MRTGVSVFYRRGMKWRRDAVAIVCGAMLSLGLISDMRSDPSPTPLRDINAVLADHDDRLLAIPGVVGVSIALLEDGKTACLKVMLSERKPAAEQPIPKSIEGHPVVIEVTGEIRPLRE